MTLPNNVITQQLRQCSAWRCPSRRLPDGLRRREYSAAHGVATFYASSDRGLGCRHCALRDGVRRSESKAPFSLNLDTILRWVVSFTPRPLCPLGTNPRWRFGGLRSWVWTILRVENVVVLPVIEPRFIRRPSSSLVTILTELSWLPAATQVM